MLSQIPVFKAQADFLVDLIIAIMSLESRSLTLHWYMSLFIMLSLKLNELVKKLFISDDNNVLNSDPNYNNNIEHNNRTYYV